MLLSGRDPLIKLHWNTRPYFHACCWSKVNFPPIKLVGASSHPSENVQASIDGQAVRSLQGSSRYGNSCVIRKVLQEASKARELVQQLKVWTGDPCVRGSVLTNFMLNHLAL
jgi:hypothetical protein